MRFRDSLMQSGMRGRIDAGLSGLGQFDIMSELPDWSPTTTAPSTVGVETTTPGTSGGFDWAGAIKAVASTAGTIGKAVLDYNVQKTNAEVTQTALKTGRIPYTPTPGVTIPNPVYIQGSQPAGIPTWLPIVAIGGLAAYLLLK